MYVAKAGVSAPGSTSTTKQSSAPRIYDSTSFLHITSPLIYSNMVWAFLRTGETDIRNFFSLMAGQASEQAAQGHR